MLETVKEFDKETIKKEKIKPSTSYHTISLKSDNIEDIVQIINSLIIEVEVPKNYKKLDT